MKAEDYLREIFGEKADWVRSVFIPFNKWNRLSIVLYGLGASESENEYKRIVFSLMDAIKREDVVGNVVTLWNPPEGYFTVAVSLPAILRDHLGEDAPLAKLNFIILGKNYMCREYSTSWGSGVCVYGQQNIPDGAVKLPGDQVRALIDTF